MAAMSISVVKGRGSIAHNNREFSTQNVDISKTPDNIIYKAESLDQAYQKLFAEEVDRYNVGKKPSRQIPNYMDHIRRSKNGEKLFYETVVQVGNKFDCSVGSEMGRKAKLVLDRYMKEFQERNPNLYVFNAVLHLDESTPHLHIDYIPVAHGYEKGLQVRNSLDKALKEQGIGGKANKKENSTHNWQEGEKARLEGIMREYGLERSPEKGLKRKHMTVDQYKAVAEQVQQEIEQIPDQVKTSLLLLNKNKISVDKSDYERLEQRAKLSIIHEIALKNIIESMTKMKDDSSNYIANKMSLALMEHDNAEKEHDRARSERMKAEELKVKYENLYNNQSKLNDKYKTLYDAYRGQQEIIESLKSENTELKKVVTVAKSLKKENEVLKTFAEDGERIEQKMVAENQSLQRKVDAIGMIGDLDLECINGQLKHIKELKQKMQRVKQRGEPTTSTELELTAAIADLMTIMDCKLPGGEINKDYIRTRQRQR